MGSGKGTVCRNVRRWQFTLSGTCADTEKLENSGDQISGSVLWPDEMRPFDQLEDGRVLLFSELVRIPKSWK